MSAVAAKIRLFQSTHPRGVRRTKPMTFVPTNQFQSTHPRGVRRRVHRVAESYRRFQSTHPRGVRQTKAYYIEAGIWVSIHAPTRGATSIAASSLSAFLFQSTHPRGVRLIRPSDISMSRCFNPRTHEGCDKASELGMIDDIKFQSTHPRGVRHQPLRCLPQRYCVSIHAPTRGATFMAAEDIHH